MTAEVLDAAPRLKVVARAGIGVDNVDVEAATRRGVMIVNAPQSNTISAAEHTMALLSQARNVPQADHELHAGRWDRERWQGVELAGKTLGLIGLGQVGTLVASRAQAFGMRVIAFDPYVSGERAKELGVDVMPTLESLLVQSDFVSIHLPGSPDTLGLIGEHQLAMVKHGARLVNTSRGGIVDEEALAKRSRMAVWRAPLSTSSRWSPPRSRRCSGWSRWSSRRTSGHRRSRRRTRRARRSPRWCGWRSKVNSCRTP